MSYFPALQANTQINLNDFPSDKNGSPNSDEFQNNEKDFPIIVHCHLCWDWVWQRPQQFISRLSRRHKILFVETIGPSPELAVPTAQFRKAAGYPNVTILRLQFPAWRWSDAEFVDQQRCRIVKEALSALPRDQFKHAVQWFYDPMAVTAFAGQMGEILTVYDCMDEMSKFKEAPANIVQREAELLRQADVVFTGGRKLFDSKSRLNSNCHFYGCGVDGEHFARANSPETSVPAALAALPRPILGFFGVIDERLDYELIASLADTDPGWSIVMIGPVLKVDQAALPSRPNLHWLGQQAYADLPAFCKGMDVCLMPFALNESTEYINPTKALEYLATGRPVVSTAVPDVVSNFGGAVSIARSPQEFLLFCRHALEMPDGAALERGLKMVADNSWESIVTRLEQHVRDALPARNGLQNPNQSRPGTAPMRRRNELRRSDANALEGTPL